ncbi:hypothetical protein JQT98_13805 [Ponticoccus sp. SC6-69]|nr:hypothetical protein [Ponticoccus sp. SC6-38]MBM1243734.1 hypothetical protein [Ponticoccus sp. SC2-64]MBM1247923.1 hypothetical protein [Ponticoccus sp. SC6-42]MBM1256474.1 hypothetical protein [Ponticoccus sp. SC6-60]MBM1265726.1 hypothetical protein [Ponticoccus sp. SC2-67]MBM1270481.1 hypothetical protein [Ponticoccus sp. SC2-37]MBM1279012.1 hypothetical protein [Ponticoccus sp. SC6-36]MBM1284407.1 hypothetical protein [Ponticoccus sp. SC6-8]MBM1288806.1 hypothetical protein [Pontico
MMRPALKDAAMRFARSEEGAGTAMGLFTLITICAVGGIAADVTRVYNKRIELQNAADMAAHAAIFNRQTMEPDVAIARAVDLVHHSLPPDHEGRLITPDYVVFGKMVDGEFVLDPESKEAAMVQTARAAERGNAIHAYLTRWIGIDAWSVRSNSIFQSYQPGCLNEGLFADNYVDISSNNSFYNGFCVHSNNYVDLQISNFFEEGTVVSMPDRNDIGLPASGFESNEGLMEALRDAYYEPTLIAQLPDIIDAMDEPGSDHMPDYITSGSIIELSGNQFTPEDFTPGAIHRILCAGGQSIQFKSSSSASVFRDVVINVPCKVKFGQGVGFEDAVIASSSTSPLAFVGPSGVIVGRDDGCAEGGGAQLLTLGSMSFASDLQAYGGQFVAAGNISFSARADGVEGVSMVAGDYIQGASLMNMGLCNGGMEDNFNVPYYRMAG